MTSYEKVEKLSEKKGITPEQAKEVLEKCNWDILDAVIYLEKNPIVNVQQTAANVSEQGAVNLNKEQQSNTENVQTVNAQAASSIPNSNCGQQGSYSTPQSPNNAQQTYTVPEGSQYDSTNSVSFSELLGRFFGFMGKIVTKGVENSFVISKNEKTVASIPLIVMILLLCFAFWGIVPIMVIGMFFDFRYSFSGPSVCKDKANNVMNKATKATEKIKEDFINGMEQGGK